MSQLLNLLLRLTSLIRLEFAESEGWWEVKTKFECFLVNSLKKQSRFETINRYMKKILFKTLKNKQTLCTSKLLPTTPFIKCCLWRTMGLAKDWHR
jgi:hypothetical protein